MRAATFVEPHRVLVTEVPDPLIETPTDAIVRVVLSGICGSDLHPYRGNEVGLDSGTVLGHEFLGEVVAVGDGVRDFRVGDWVVSPFSTSCGECFFCSTSLTARCVKGQLFGWVEAGAGLHGGQAELVRVPLADGTLISMPPELGPSASALFAGDILSTGLFAATAGDVSPGTTVAVVGAGPVGLMALVAATELGAQQVWAIDPVAARRSLASGFGAVSVGPDDALESIRADTSGHGVDVVVEAVGTPEATALAYAIVRPGGALSAAGVHTEPGFPFSPGEAYDKNLTYTAGRSSARVFAKRALEIAASGRHDLEAVVSHTLPLEEAAAGYEMFDARSDGCTKVLLRP